MADDWRPDSYLDEIRAEVPQYDELQERAAAATADVRAGAVLELGVGTGETARRLLALHPSAKLVGVDGSEAMLAAARVALPLDRVELRLARLEDPLPTGPYDLIVSVLAVHHLRADGKADLFRRINASLAGGGRFVLADVVVPVRPEDAVVPIEEGFDFPDPLADQLSWLAAAGFSASVVWSSGDLAVVRAELQASV